MENIYLKSFCMYRAKNHVEGKHSHSWTNTQISECKCSLQFHETSKEIHLLMFCEFSIFLTDAVRKGKSTFIILIHSFLYNAVQYREDCIHVRCVCVRLSVYLSVVYLPVCQSVCISVCLSICLSVFLHVCLSICLAGWLAGCQSVCLLSACLSTCLPVFVYIIQLYSLKVSIFF